MKKQLFTTFLKGLATTLLIGFSFSPSKAQTAASYLFSALPGTYTEITGGTEIFEVEDDDASSNTMIPIGFPFNFCGGIYNSCKPNSNGWMSFANVFPGAFEMRTNDQFYLNQMTPMVQPLWDDMAGYNGGICKYETTGSTPNRVFTMEWRGWTWYYYVGSQTISFQVKLYETSNVIEYVYRQEPGLLDGFSEAATIGIANTDLDFQTLDNSSTNPTPSSTIFYDYIYQKPATGQIYRWSPPLACTGTPNAGTAVTSVSTLNCEGSATLSLTGNTIATALEYQWQYSTDGGTTWINLGSVQTTIPISTGTITQTTQYRAIVTCTASSQSATSAPVTVTVTGPIAGTASAAPAIVCNGGTSAISLTGNTTTGVNYQWQSSADNTTFNNVTGTQPTYNTSGITGPVYFRSVLTCAVNGLSANSGSVMVDTLVSTPPSVGTSTFNITCGQSATLTATPAMGAVINWYTTSSGGSPVATGSSVNVTPSVTTTYYAENSIPFISTGQMATVMEHGTLTGDDHGGIALSQNYAYYNGDANTGRFNKSDLTGGTAFPLRDGFFGDQANGQLWQLSSNTTLGSSFNGGTVTRLYELNENLTTTGVFVNLSQPITMAYGSMVAPGSGYVILYNGSSQFYHVNLGTGVVTALGNGTFTFAGAESWAAYGFATTDGTNYYVTYILNSTTISRVNANSVSVSTVQNMTSLSDMAAIAYSPQNGRMYFHHEYNSQWQTNSSSETIGFINVNLAGCSNPRTPVVVNVSPYVPTINPSGTVNVCIGNTQTLTAPAGVTFQWYLNNNPIPGATSQTYAAGTAGNYTVQVTTGQGCNGTSAATTVTITPGQVPSVNVSVNPNDTICAGDIVTFTAAPTNGGTNPSYQWKKNGLNVGINNPVYTGTGLVNGDQISVIMTVGSNICVTTPTATSPVITMNVSANVVPAVTITANPGTTACVDDAVTFMATPTNGGTTPAYQWKVNGSNVGTNSANYTAAAGSLGTGDIVSVVMTPSLLCVQPATTSANVTMTINPLVTPTVSIAADQTTLCQGATVTFTATDNAPGGTYQWYVNGVAAGPNNATYAFVPNFNDVVSLEFTPPAAGCYDNLTVTSNSVPLSITPGLPTMATVSSTGAVTEGTMITVYANLFNFNTSYSIDWYINSNLYTTTTVPYMSYLKGPGQDVIYAIASNSGSGCYLTATTNSITIEGWATSVGNTVVQGGVEVYPNPFSSDLMIKGLADGDHVILMNMLGQAVQEWHLEKVTSEQQIIIKDMAAGTYLLNIRDKDGNFKDMKKLQKM